MRQRQSSSIPVAIWRQVLDGIPEKRREDLLSIWSVTSVFMREGPTLGHALGWGSLHAIGSIANAMLFRLAFSAAVPGGLWWLLLIPPHVALQQLLVRRRFQEAVNKFADTGRAGLYDEITRTLTRARRPYTDKESKRLQATTERHVTNIWDLWRAHLPWLALDAMVLVGALAGVFVVVGSVGAAAVATSLLCGTGAWIAYSTYRAVQRTEGKQRLLEARSETRQRRLLQVLDRATWSVFDRTGSQRLVESAIGEATAEEKKRSIDADRDRVIAGGHATVATATLDVAAVMWAALSSNFALLPLVYLVQMVGQIAGRLPDHVLAIVSRLEPTRDIGKTLRTPPLIREHPDARSLSPIRSGITVDRVSVRHANGSIGLQDVSLEIAAGEVVALIGEIGSGKTTFLDVLRGHVELTAGTVKFDGHDLRWARHADVDGQIAFVPQKFELINLYGGTVAENLRVARRSATPGEMIQVCEATGFDRWLDKDGHGLDTPISSSTVSGGERQSLEIARMLLMPAAILLIDEATAALDGEGTDRFVNLVREAKARKQTVVLVTHAARVARTADRVVTLSAGKIVESGAPGDLLRDPSSLFAAMCRAGNVATPADDAVDKTNSQQPVEDRGELGPQRAVEVKGGIDPPDGLER